MKVAVFDVHNFERPLFEELNKSYGHKFQLFDLRLTEDTAHLVGACPVVCAFAHDKLNARVLEILRNGGVKLVALRSAGFNHVDLAAAKEFGIHVVRVPAYSPYSVAEHAVALILALDRKICRAVARVRELNFSLDGLVGFDLHGKTVGIIGTGRIGSVFARIMAGFGCHVLAYDLSPNEDLSARTGAHYVSLEELYRRSDIISLHLPLSRDSRHLIDANALAKMKRGVMLINTGRGGLIDTAALINALKSGQVGTAGLDVYEEEENVFFQDLSATVLQDDVLARLMTFPNVLITAHQAFLTQEALRNIVETTLKNIQDFERGLPLINEVKVGLA
jgi:D-lactate dehydrogenase